MVNRERQRRKKRPSVWVSIGAVVLIIILVMWLTDAMYLGDTDVSAPPLLEAILLV